jgi:diguanylate cyclase (GGDEF)-like protein/PAS domain S-box-containing protein
MNNAPPFRGGRRLAHGGDEEQHIRFEQPPFDSLQGMTGLFDADCCLVHANARLGAVTGSNAAELVGKRPTDFLRGRNVPSLEQAIHNAARSGHPGKVGLWLDCGEGALRFHVFEVMPAGVTSKGSEHALVYGIDADDVFKQHVGAEVASSQDMLQAAMRTIPDLFWVKGLDGRYTHCNDVFNDFNKLTKSSMVGRTASESVLAKNLEIHKRTDAEALGSRTVVQFELEVPREMTGGSESRYYSVQKVAVRNADDEVTGLLGIARDITVSRMLEQEIRANEQSFRQLLDNMSDCIARHDLTGKIVYYNAAFRQFVEDRLNTSIEQFAHRVKAELPVLTELRKIGGKDRRASKPYSAPVKEIAFTATSGKVVTHEVRYFPEYAADGTLASVLGVGRDITERKNAERRLQENEKELTRLAYTDNLTGLANRVTMRETLRAFLESSTAEGSKVAVLTLDIDRFKSINDTLGHILGDDLLIEFANRLKRVVGDRAWLGRLGGDEFIVILPDMPRSEVACDIATEIITVLNQPMQLSGSTIRASVSIGIAVGPDDSTSETELLRFSDISLYKAKSKGRGHLVFYTRSMSEEAETRFNMEAMINDGLREHQFEAYFQAKVDLKSREIVGAEALCRWNHPKCGLVPPAHFIPIAEETGQIVEIGSLVLEQACAFAVACNSIAEQPFRVAVNVSARQFAFGGFLGVLGECLEKTGCKAEWLELEITESLLMAENEWTIETLNAIASLGILISIDDFGTGYSALGYLRHMPIGGLKIDRSFVTDLGTEQSQETLVRTVLAMASELDMKSVAEGVETAEAADILQSLGCDLGQGYLWHRPSPAKELFDRLKAHTKTRKRKSA